MSSGLRFLIINTDYGAFLDELYARHPGLEGRGYDEQMRARNESLFGVADFYSTNLRRLGHEAWEVHVNNPRMQAAWAREHGWRVRRPFPWRPALGRQFPWFFRREAPPAIPYDVLTRQVEHYRPDVILNQAMDEVDTAFLRSLKPRVRLLAGQVASPISDGRDWGVYDLVISSLPNFVDYFRKRGVRGELNRLGFEPAVLERVRAGERSVPVSFVGSLFAEHADRVALLESLCEKTPIRVWGNGVERLPAGSPIRARYQGTVWGADMYRVLLSSQITVNRHICIAGDYANNMRLYEATGSGALLVTDWKENLAEMFEPGKEVVTYRTPEECAERVAYYLGHAAEREAIARAGQERTLRDHNYLRRMEEFGALVEEHLSLTKNA
jgi:hypothetical protein